MQGAGLDQRKIGQQSAVLLNSFYPAHQIALGRMVQVNDRRPRFRFVFNNNIDFKLGELVFFLLVHSRQQCRQGVALLRRSIVFFGQKLFDIIDNMILNVFQKLRGFAVSFIFLSQIVDRVFDRHFDELFAQQRTLATLTVFPFGQILGRFFNFFLHQVQIVDQLLFFIFRQFVKSFRTQDLAVFNRCNHQPDLHMQQGYAFAFGLFLQNAHIFFFFLFVFFANNAQAGLILVTVQHRRDGHAEIFDQLIDVFGKFGCAAGRETDAFRLIRLVKVINIDPIAGSGTFFGFFFQNPFDQTGFSGSLRSQTK